MKIEAKCNFFELLNVYKTLFNMIYFLLKTKRMILKYVIVNAEVFKNVLILNL